MARRKPVRQLSSHPAAVLTRQRRQARKEAEQARREVEELRAWRARVNRS